MLNKGPNAQSVAEPGGSEQSNQAEDPERVTSLRIKLWLVIALTLIALVGVLYFPLRTTVLQRFVDLEPPNMVTDLERTTEAINAQLIALGNSAGDYGAWSDTYSLVYTTNQEFATSYVRDNLANAIFDNSRLNMVMIVNAEGQIVFSKTYDLETKTLLPFPEELRSLTTSDFVKFPDLDERKSGITMLPDKAVLLGSSPVLPTDYASDTPVNGALIFGRFLTAKEQASLAETTKLTLTFHLLNQANALPPDSAARLKNGERNVVALPDGADGGRIQGFSAINDIGGQPALAFQVDAPRNIYALGKRGIFLFMLYLTIGALIFGLVVGYLLERFILARLSRLNKKVREIGLDRDTGDRVAVQGNDELSQLSRSINTMLGALQDSQSEHMRSDEERGRLQENLIKIQQATLDKLSTPIIPISDSVIVMPLIGAIDDARAKKILETLLQGIGQLRTRTAIIDITGIEGVDSATTTLLTRMIGAVHLLGAQLVLTGISAEVAQTLAKNPTLISGISTYSNLQQAIVTALRS